MNYIGSKFSLLDFLDGSINGVLIKNKEVKPKSKMVFADLFAGTGCVGGFFKSQGYSIIANDIQYYSYVITKHMIENNGNLDKEKMTELIEILNKAKGKEGFIYKNYSYEGTEGQEFRRMYFTADNAKKCDEIRETIEKWLSEKKINQNEYYFLLGSLINSIDKCANTASVYGAFLKKIKKSALKSMVIEPLPFNFSNCSFELSLTIALIFDSIICFFLLCALLLQQGRDLFPLIAQAQHSRHKRADMPLRQLPLCRLDHGPILRYKSSRGALAVHQSVPLQLRHGPLHGVGVHPGLRGQVPHGGQPLPRRKHAGDDPDLDLLDELGVDGGIIGKLPSHPWFLQFCISSCVIVLSN